MRSVGGNSLAEDVRVQLEHVWAVGADHAEVAALLAALGGGKEFGGEEGGGGGRAAEDSVGFADVLFQ